MSSFLKLPYYGLDEINNSPNLTILLSVIDSVASFDENYELLNIRKNWVEITLHFTPILCSINGTV